MHGTVLEVSGLRKTFGDLVAVDDVSFHIVPGETYGLLGPNGAGKTTTISMSTGLLQRDGGDVRIMGEPMTTTSLAPKAKVGLVPQELAIYPDLTARENLAFFGKLYGIYGSELHSRIDEVLDIIGLQDRADDRADEFSGGMKRRLNIGIGLFHRPQLLVLDEPTVGVDPQSRNAILESVERLSGEGMAVLYTTHYMEEAERLCDRIGIIDAGKIIAEGTRRHLVNRVGERDRIRIGVAGHADGAVAKISDLAGIVGASESDGFIDVIADDAASILTSVLEAVASADAAVSSVEIEEPDLEAVFLHLTGKALRD